MEGVELKEEWQDEDFPRYRQTRRHPKHPFVGVFKDNIFSDESLGLSQRKRSWKTSFLLGPLKRRKLVIKTQYHIVDCRLQNFLKFEYMGSSDPRDS